MPTFETISSEKFDGPVFIEIRINNKVNYSHELARPKDLPIERKNKFMKYLNNNL